MADAEQKRRVILESEARFADRLGGRVIDRPELSIWMILIPIIFVHYFYRYNRYKTGRESFARHYMITRRRALDAAAEALDRLNRAEEALNAALTPHLEGAGEPVAGVIRSIESISADLRRADAERMFP